MIRNWLSLLPTSQRGRFAAYFVLTITGVILRALSAVLLIPLVSALFEAEPSAAWPWVGALTAATAVGWAVDAVAARLGYRVGFALLDATQHDVADRIADTSLSWFTTENARTARQAIAATGPDLVGLFAYLFTPLIGAVTLPAALGVALLPISWQLGLTALAGVPILLGAFWASIRITRRADRVATETNAVLTERILEFARTQQALRAARRAEPARSHVGAALAEQHGATLRLLTLQAPGQLLFGLATQLALVLLAATTTVLAMNGTLGVPEAIALIVVIARYLEAFTALGELAGAIENTGATIGRIVAVLTAPATSSGTRTPDDPGRPPRIELRDVSFRYPSSGEAVLDGLDLILHAGTTTAIVGPSGSGKSTVLSLIAGLQEPTGGAILADGVDVRELRAESRRSLASMVFQHPYLFDGSIRDNVRSGDPSADSDRMTRALTLSRVDEVTARMADGELTTVGEGGTTLSGGERQRVSIARALVSAAPMLLVDEATSALDTENETAIIGALKLDPTPRTKVVVAHRLASIRTADRVIFLQSGRIVEDDTVDGLLAGNGRFADFWRQQESSADWRLGADLDETEPHGRP